MRGFGCGQMIMLVAGLSLTSCFVVTCIRDISQGEEFKYPLLAFGAFGIVLLSVVAFRIITIRKNAKIEKNGKDGTGVYLEHGLEHEIVTGEGNNEKRTPFYSIYFAFKNDFGQIIETKTNGREYTKQMAEKIAELETFPIKYMGDIAVIIEENLSIEKEK